MARAGELSQRVPAQDLAPPARGDLPLGPLLVGTDFGTALIAAGAVALLGTLVERVVFDAATVLLLAAVPFGTVATATATGLYQRRKCAIASIEISRIGQLAAVLGVLLLLVLQAADSIAPYTTAAATATTLFVSLVLGRSSYRQWLKRARAEGRYLTPIALVGDVVTVQQYAKLLRENPEAGYVPVAHVDTRSGEPGDVPPGSVPRVGRVDEPMGELLDLGVKSAVVLAPHMDTGEVNYAVRSAQRTFEHVQVVTSLVGVSHARLVPTPLVNETTFYLEPVVASSWQRTAKRATDVVLSLLLLLLAAPLLLLAAAAIRLTDGGPVLYAQERVGRHGRPILIRKLRSMVVEADELTDEVAEGNDRVGPLYKSADDPRITDVGRFLRATSLDELPQLFSILVGDMSLVGPRPALPAEVAAFDDDHQRRHEVRPGLTGLWQVEDRDHPDFERYRRHDVFYIENWSLSLDLAIILQTAATVVARAARALTGSAGEDVGT